MVILPVTMVPITMMYMSIVITIITIKIIIKSLLPEIKYSSRISSFDQLLIRSARLPSSYVTVYFLI